MKKVVEKIIQSEHDAQKTIEEARLQAEKIKKQADEKAKSIVNKALEEARKEAGNLIQRCQKEAEDIKNKELKSIKTEKEYNIPDLKLKKIADKMIDKYLFMDEK